MSGAFFSNSGSEATEAAVKLARTYWLSTGQSQRYKVISRWQSYHGITMGALSWTGVTLRRKDFQPYLKESFHIPPAYCYRCWFGKSPGTCDLDCAGALEDAILAEGPETIAAFMAEPVVGTSISGAVPPYEYFTRIRQICDRYEVLYIADEVMTGAGRTGDVFFASDHFNAKPDIIAFGKGVGAGYYPLAGVLCNQLIIETISRGEGMYAASQSHSGHPLGMAAGHAVLDYVEKNEVLHQAAKTGAHLGRRLNELFEHPSVGDVRGLGMMWGIEFVRDRDKKLPYEPALSFHTRIYDAARSLGLLVLPSNGCNRGCDGDMVLFGPPLISTDEQIDQMVDILDRSISQVESETGMMPSNH